jgi:hypothetical protein
MCIGIYVCVYVEILPLMPGKVGLGACMCVYMHTSVYRHVCVCERESECRYCH